MVSTPASAARPSAGEPSAMRAWMKEMMEGEATPERALALIGIGLVGRMTGSSSESEWSWIQPEDGTEARLDGLRRRLETIALAINTGAPLTTQEVSQLLGARPGSDRARRGDVQAERLSRNVWRLSRVESSGREVDGGRMNAGFSEAAGRRRRL
ncbi:hypothetical protein [Synechococcus sp. RSCCF101]|uniref:hypothetical protein n=1 Tax=Synechococcus sp. RSCCF101 TaxID=2511069 RepID=UPI00177F666B|nr:hypothetical protein [Synechococcus sp. RSCCF101]